MASLRLYLAGRLAIEAGRALVLDRQFPGRQGRLLFACLALERSRPVPRGELVDVLWGDDPPREVDSALSALVSKVRSVLQRADPAATITSEHGQHQLRLPAQTWIDLEAAAAAIDEAEGALRAEAPERAWGFANVAAAIARRPLMPGESAGWIERHRRELGGILIRALDCLAQVSLERGELPLAVQHAAAAIDAEPFRETGYQRLMRAHAAMGNRAEALRVYERCRTLLREELGTGPSPETEALFLTLLRQ